MSTITQSESLITPNLISRSGAEEGVILGDAMGSGLINESDFSIAGFPTIGSCLLDLSQLVACFNNRFQVIAANIDSWRNKLVAKLRLYGSTIADLVSTSRSISNACDVNAGAALSSTERLESITEQLNRLETSVSSNCDDILLVRGIIDQLHAISDSQVSL